MTVDDLSLPPNSIFIIMQVRDQNLDISYNSGIAKLGHTGAHALASGGCAPPVQGLLKIIGAECTIINHELGAKSAQRC